MTSKTSSRRRTLSHSEIESFLSEISYIPENNIIHSQSNELFSSKNNPPVDTQSNCDRHNQLSDKPIKSNTFFNSSSAISSEKTADDWLRTYCKVARYL